MIFMLAILTLASASMFCGVVFGMAHGIEKERKRMKLRIVPAPKDNAIALDGEAS